MTDLTPDLIKQIHNVVEQTFPTVTRGIKDKGLIEAAAQRPNLVLGNYTPFDDLYTKAASIMEAITRWHPFIDGNKRTGLLAAFLYLYGNGRYLAIPLDAVRFTVKIAENQNREWEDTKKLIDEIAKWLKEHTGENDNDFVIKALRYSFLPSLKLWLMSKFGFKKRAQKKLEYWFAVDVHEDYAKEIGNISNFLMDIMNRSMKEVLEKRKVEKQLKKQQSKKALQQ
jgi:death-on-curing protein